MGLDLKLLPMRNSNMFSHEVLIVDDHDKFAAIMEISSMEIEDGFTSFLSSDAAFEETHYGDTTETPYGERLMWVQAKQLKAMGLSGPTGAFVAAMKDHDRVALFWC